MIFEYSGLNYKRKAVNVFIEAPEIIELDKDKNTDFDLVFKRIVLDVLDHNKNTSTLNVSIELRKDENKVLYYIKDKTEKSLHEIVLTLEQTDKQKIIGEIAKQHIIQLDQSKKEVGLESILDRFSTMARPVGLIGKFLNIMGQFFSKIRENFRLIDRWWEGITNQSAKRLKWDLAVLSDICGTVAVDKMTLGQALKCMSEMLDRERSELVIPSLSARIKTAIAIDQDLALLRKKFKEENFEKLVKNLQKSISSLKDQKLLLPVGYKENDQMVEMLLEIDKHTDGKYTVSLISASQETRDLFDREVGIEVGHQSIRREISDVSEADLLAMIPIFIELQTSPICLSPQNTPRWRHIFLQSLCFDQSACVKVGKVTESYKNDRTFGHLTEAIFYVKGEYETPDQSKSFELAARLRFFLDICKNKKDLKNKEFWTLIRTTAIQLAELIEKNKHLVREIDRQGKELTNIYTELKEVLDYLDKSLPEMIDLRDQVIPLLSGHIEVEAESPTPVLAPLLRESNDVYPQIDPPLASLNSHNPLQSIKNWSSRCRQLIDLDQLDKASQEAKLIVRMFPQADDPFWTKLGLEDSKKLLKDVETISEAIARASHKKSQLTLQDISTAVALNYYAYTLTKKFWPKSLMLEPFICLAQQAMADLLKERLSESDYFWLRKFDVFDPGFIYQRSYDQLKDFLKDKPIPPDLQSIINVSQFTSITIGVEKNKSPLPPSPLVFQVDPTLTIYLKGNRYWQTSLKLIYKTPINLIIPNYATEISQEITNRYLSEFCCLGCIRDNCPNYNKVDKHDHRFHPLYMLHNYVDIFCENLVSRGLFYRDEISDLMYTQQTNQNANILWKNVHHREHGFSIANGFNEEDIRTQVLNTFIIFLEHPHFFKQADFRWQFEIKVLNNRAFSQLLLPEHNNMYHPFLISMLKKLKKEINISSVEGDIDTAAYLISMADELKEIIKNSQMQEDEKRLLVATLNIEDVDHRLFQWSQNLIGKNDESSIEKQKVVLSLLLNRYYKKFCNNSQDPCFTHDKDLEFILCSIAHLESLVNVEKKIDPEVRDKYLMLRSWLVSSVKAKISQDKTPGDFVNKILFYLNPSVASLRLQWDPLNFPTMMALDQEGKFYQFNIFTGQMNMGETRTEEIPENIQQDKNLQHLFGSSLANNWKVFGSSQKQSTTDFIAYTNDKFPNQRILIKKGLKYQIIIQRAIQNDKGKNKWFTYVKFNEQEQYLSGHDVSSISDIPPTVAAVIGSRHCWIDQNKSTLYVFNTDEKDPYAKIKLKKIEQEDKESETIIQDVHLIEEGVHLLAPNEKMLESFSSIEDPKFILTKGTSKYPSSLHYFRYEFATTGIPLVYELSKKGAYTNAFPGYQLEKYGVRPGKTDPAYGVLSLPKIFDGFQLLKKDGDERVFIPLRQFEQQFNSAGDPLPLSKPIFPQNYAKCPLFDYHVDQETNRLVAKSGDAYAYLAYLCFAHWDYDSASYYLNKARTSAGYQENYDKILQWVNDLKDDTLNGVALNLRFEIFRERVMEDQYMHKIRKGKLGEVEEISIQRIPRLIHIADLYEKYIHFINRRETGGEGPDHALDLSSDEEQYVVHLIKELLKEHGNQNIHTHELKPVRAEEIPIQSYLKKDEKDFLDINIEANLIWMYKGNTKDRSSLTVKDPKWILQNFQDVFNQILELDPQSPGFKQIEHQVRLVSELPNDTLTELEINAIQKAQYYLVKLLSIRQLNQNSLDPTFMDQFKENLGANGKLPKIQGPFFRNSRMKCFQRMQLLASCFDRFALSVPDRAFDTIGSLDQLDEKGLKYSIERFISNWEKKKKPSSAFKKDFKIFLMNEVYGSSATKSLVGLDNIFKLLDSIPLVQSKQKMQFISPLPPKPLETYQSKYSHLVTLVESPMGISLLETLEKDIEQQVEEVPRQRMSLSEKTSYILGDNFVSVLEKSFEVKSIKAKEISEKIFDDLAQSAEASLMRLAEENRKDMQAYIKDHKQVLMNRINAENLNSLLINEIQEVKIEKEKLNKDLLQFVEQFNTPAGILAMRRLTGKSIKPSLDFIISLWRRGEIDQFWDNHPFKKAGMKKISENLLKQLNQDISYYLELSTKYQHLNDILDQNNAYISSCGKDPLAIGNSQIAEVIYDSIQTKRHFTLDSLNSLDSRDLLFLEYSQKIILRKQQVEILHDMLSDPNAVRQLRMGGGKSKVLLPLLAQRKATGKNLVMLMLPEELYETNCMDLDNTNRQLFGQEMSRFDFSRHSDKSEKALQHIYMGMLKTIKNKGFMMTTKRSMLSFKNAYLELFNKLNSLTKEALQSERSLVIGQIRAMSKIFKLFYDKTDVLADEVDACLDVRKEVNFALGESKPIDQVKVDMGAKLMDIILAAKIDEPLYELNKALQDNTQAAISPKKRKKLMKHLTSAYYDKHREILTEVDKTSFVNYILNKGDEQATEEWVFKLKESRNSLFKEVATLKAFMEQGFGTTLGRIGNVNYGRDPISGQWTIPYKASETPNIGSEYDDDIEQISYTIQDYLLNGVTYKQVYRVIAQMHNQAIAEMRQSNSDDFINIIDTKGGRKFETFIKEVDPDRKLGENVNLSTVCTPKNIAALVATINSTPKGRLAFCYKQVIKRIRQYPEQINSLSTDVTAIVNHFGGFTGTPWNLHTYDDKINVEKSLGVDGITWSLMLGRDTEILSFDFNAQKPVDSILVNLDVVGKYQAVIDTGAYLRGISNQDFIDRSLEIAEKQGIRIGGGIYFDKTGKIVKKQHLNETPLPIEVASSTELMTNLTLYDQAHTVGADIKQGRKAKAIVTIGENTFIRDLFQGIWRLRQIHQEQTVVLVVSDTIKKRILDGKEGKLTIEDILKFCLMNEARREPEDNFKAEKAKIQGFTKKLMIKKIVNSVTENDNDNLIIELAHQFASEKAGLFIKKRAEEAAYDQYAKLKTKEIPSKIFEKYKDIEKEKYEKAKAILEKINQKPLVESIESEERKKLIERPSRPADWFPDKVESIHQEGGEVEQEAQAEIEQELELTLETEQITQSTKEINIPMMKSTNASHGDVRPLIIEAISGTIKNGICSILKIVDEGDTIYVEPLRELTRSLDYFDPGIFCSAVFERNLSTNTELKIPPQCVFYSNRKPVKNVLIVKSNEKWTMIIPTIHEAHASCRNFIFNVDKDTQAVEVAISTKKPLLIYKSGIELSDNLPFTDKDDENEFYRLYIQAKLFNGEIEYSSDEEKNALKRWLISKGPENFKLYFEENILAAKPRRFAEAYPKSSLFAIFKELV